MHTVLSFLLYFSLRSRDRSTCSALLPFVCKIMGNGTPTHKFNKCHKILEAFERLNERNNCDPSFSYCSTFDNKNLYILAFQHCTYHNQMCLELSSPIYNMFNTKLNVLIKIICLRKSEVSVERISVCNVVENLAEHSIHSTMLLYQYVIDM